MFIVASCCPLPMSFEDVDVVVVAAVVITSARHELDESGVYAVRVLVDTFRPTSLATAAISFELSGPLVDVGEVDTVGCDASLVLLDGD